MLLVALEAWRASRCSCSVGTGIQYKAEPAKADTANTVMGRTKRDRDLDAVRALGEGLVMWDCPGNWMGVGDRESIQSLPGIERRDEVGEDRRGVRERLGQGGLSFLEDLDAAHRAIQEVLLVLAILQKDRSADGDRT
jgi:hypothetical protein